MNFKGFLKEFESTQLAYHDDLNPAFWEHGELLKFHGGWLLKEEVRQQLLTVGLKFAESLGLPPDAITDYVLTGSNANYNWTRLSDLDVHLMIDPKKIEGCESCKTDLESCLLAKKSLWNDRHDITTYGYPVEVYASMQEEKTVAGSGSYSLLKQIWLTVPVKKEITIDEANVKAKAEELAHEIDAVITSEANDPDAIDELTDKLWRMRQSGLERAGEFSTENLVFKALRNNGYIEKIRTYALTVQDHSLSLEGMVNETAGKGYEYCMVWPSEEAAALALNYVTKETKLEPTVDWNVMYFPDKQVFDRIKKVVNYLDKEIKLVKELKTADHHKTAK